MNYTPYEVKLTMQVKVLDFSYTRRLPNGDYIYHIVSLL